MFPALYGSVGTPAISLHYCTYCIISVHVSLSPFPFSDSDVPDGRGCGCLFLFSLKCSTLSPLGRSSKIPIDSPYLFPGFDFYV